MKRFARQTIITNNPRGILWKPDEWLENRVGEWTIWHCPSVSITTRNVKDKYLIAVGYILNPEDKAGSTAGILEKALEKPSWKETQKEISKMTGRFWLVYWNGMETRAMGDPGGTRPIFYNTKSEIGTACLCSNPKLLAKALNRKESEGMAKAKKENCYWMPVTMEMYEGIRGLLPNHELDVESGKPARFWPTEPIKKWREDEAAILGATRLEKNILAGAERFPLALGLTGGYDSRLILAGCRSIRGRIKTYSLQYKTMNGKERDIRIPRKLAEKAKVDHNVIICAKEPTPEFLEEYEANTWRRKPDYQHIAYNLDLNFPKGHICVKGDISEAIRFTNYLPGLNPKIAAWQHCQLWQNVPEALKEIDNWFEEALPVCKASGVEPLNLFTWEQRFGGAKMQSYMDSDPSIEKFTPYNDRVLMEIVFGAPLKSRTGPWFSLHRKMISHLWKELEEITINKGRIHNLLAHVKRLLLKRRETQKGWKKERQLDPQQKDGKKGR